MNSLTSAEGGPLSKGASIKPLPLLLRKLVAKKTLLLRKLVALLTNPLGAAGGD
jgi:hypothetical protein